MRSLQAARSWAEMVTRRSMRAVRVSFHHCRTLDQSDAAISETHGPEGRGSASGLTRSGPSSCIKQGGELYAPNPGSSGTAESDDISGCLVERPTMMHSFDTVDLHAPR